MERSRSILRSCSGGSACASLHPSAQECRRLTRLYSARCAAPLASHWPRGSHRRAAGRRTGRDDRRRQRQSGRALRWRSARSRQAAEPPGRRLAARDANPSGWQGPRDLAARVLGGLHRSATAAREGRCVPAQDARGRGRHELQLLSRRRRRDLRSRGAQGAGHRSSATGSRSRPPSGACAISRSKRPWPAFPRTGRRPGRLRTPGD